jgi:hypothetical protein
LFVNVPAKGSGPVQFEFDEGIGLIMPILDSGDCSIGDLLNPAARVEGGDL